MSRKAEILKKLYKEGKITVEGLKKAFEDGVITQEEYLQILDSELLAQ